MVKIRTGGELWALLNLSDSELLLRKVAECLAYARHRWPSQRTVVEGLTMEQLAAVKKIARKLTKQSQKEVF